MTAGNGVLTLFSTAGLSFIVGNGTGDTVMTFTGTLAQINTAMDGLTFTPDANFSGAATLQIDTNDQGNSGPIPQFASDTIQINVTAVNDAPLLAVPGPQITSANALLFSSAGGNAIAISDVDAGGGLVDLSLTASSGTVTLASTTGLVLLQGTGTSDAQVVVRGLISDINAALDGLSFQPTAIDSQLQIDVDDRGNTGSGGTLTSSQAIAITQVPLIPPPPTVVGSGGGGSGGSGSGDSDSDSQDESADSSTTQPLAGLIRTADESPVSQVTRSNSAGRGGGSSSAQISSAVALSGKTSTSIENDATLAAMSRGTESATGLDAVHLRHRSGDASFSSAAWWKEIDAANDLLESETTSAWSFGTVVGLGALSAGYLALGARAATLVASALSSLPVWRSFDPLPILEFWERNNKKKPRPDKDRNEDDASLEETLEL